jgi:hypothetical protein
MRASAASWSSGRSMMVRTRHHATSSSPWGQILIVSRMCLTP